MLVNLLAAWVRLVERHSHLVVLLIFVLTFGAAIYSWLFSRINSDLSTLIKPSDEVAWYQDDLYFKASFPSLQQTAVVVLSGTDALSVEASARRLYGSFNEGGQFDEVFAPALLPFIDEHKLYFLSDEDLTLWIQAVQYHFGVMLRLADEASVANFVFTLADQLSASYLLPVPEPLQSIADSLGDAVQVRAFPRLFDRSEGPHYQLIILRGKPDHAASLPNAAIVDAIRNVINSAEIDGGVTVRLTGEVALSDEEISAGLQGVEIAGMLSLILLAVILGVGIGSLKAIAMIFALLLSGVVLTTGYATLAVGSFNTLALIFVVMFFGLGVDFAVHFLLRVMEADGDAPSVLAASDIGPALILCMLTSMIAFLSFAPTAYVGLAELGVISAGGMCIAFLLTITLLPALFGVFGLPRSPQSTRGTLVQLRLPPRLVLLITAVLAGVAIYAGRGVQFDYSVLAMRDADTEAMSTLLELQREKIATDYSIFVIAGNASEANKLKEVLLDLPLVGSVSTPQDFVPSGQARKGKVMADALSLYSEISSIEAGDSRDNLAAAISYLDESVETLGGDNQQIYDKLMPQLQSLLNDPVKLRATDAAIARALDDELGSLRALLSARSFGFESVPGEITSRLRTPAGELLMSVQPASPLTSREATEAFIGAVSKVAPNVAGRSVIEWGVGEIVVESFVLAGASTVVAIFGVLLLYFRNLRYPLMVLTPIFLALIFTLAVSGLTSLSLNMANVLVVPLIIGLGVDTGIHVVHRFQHAASVRAVLQSSTSRAIVISALTTMGTFFSLSFSPHNGAASVGLLLTIAIGLMLVCTFVVLPALLSQFGGHDRDPQVRSP